MPSDGGFCILEKDISTSDGGLQDILSLANGSSRASSRMNSGGYSPLKCFDIYLGAAFGFKVCVQPLASSSGHTVR